MKRHLLLSRQKFRLTIASRLQRNQPLVEYIIQQQVLPAALGFFSARIVHTASPTFNNDQPRWVLPATQLSMGDESLTQSQPEEILSEALHLTTHVLPPAENAPEPVRDLLEPADVLQQIAPAPSTAAILPDQEGLELTSLIEPETTQLTPPLVQPAEFPQPSRPILQPSRPILRARSHIAEIQPGIPEPEGEVSESTNKTPQGPREPKARHAKPVLAKETPGTKPPLTKEASQEQRGSEPGANAEELFAPNGSDRSPQAWLARLTRRAQKEAQLARPTAPGPAARETEPVSQRTRMFLKPLLGIDPAGVRIYRDAQAEQATSNQRADALSGDASIEIAPGYAEETPEALGLLAHELAHVARQQSPRFIPPVARPSAPKALSAPAPTLETLDEEALALHVERQVRQVAQAERVQPDLSNETRERGTTDPNRAIWGNLPAPWEPLPDWLNGVPSLTSSSAPTSQMPFAAPVQPVLAMTSPVLSTNQDNDGYISTETEVRRAGTERSVDTANEEVTPPLPTQVPEPDLDLLAQQVYSLLKRRLSVEQRREW